MAGKQTKQRGYEGVLMAKKCKLISLDTSSTKSGWAYFENAKYKESGVIDLSKYKGGSEDRLKEMCLNLLTILEKYKPDMIVIEKLNVSRNMNAVRVLSKVIGAVYTYYIQNDSCSYFEVQPTQWRSRLGMQDGRKKREELKKMSVEYVRDNLDIEVSDDEADAICAGFGYIKLISENS